MFKQRRRDLAPTNLFEMPLAACKPILKSNDQPRGEPHYVPGEMTQHPSPSRKVSKQHASSNHYWMDQWLLRRATHARVNTYIYAIAEGEPGHVA